MQHVQLPIEEVSLFLQVDPDQPVPFQRETRWAQCIRSRVDAAVGEKFSVMTAADRALHLVAHIKEPKGFQSDPAEELKVAAGHIPDQK